MLNTNNSQTPSLVFRSFFSGGGIADIGAINAGFTPVSAVEYNPNPKYGSADCISEWYRKNIGDHCICEDISTVDRSQFGNCDLMHFSPTCVNFSVAKKGGVELQVDRDMATAIADIVESSLPRAVSVENVSAYRNSESFKTIVKRLTALGYQYHYAVYDMADYGVPQNRKRLVLRAVLSDVVPALLPTHCDPKKLSKARLQGNTSYEGLLPWNGWYAAIEDLLPELTDSHFAKWQLSRMSESLHSTILCSGTDATLRQSFEPAVTVTAAPRNGMIADKAILFSDQTAGCNNGERCVGSRLDFEPSQTVDTRPATKLKVYDHGRIVKLNSRCLARFMTIPDWYQLPSKIPLAGRIIGNGIPSLFYQRVAESLIPALS